MLKNLLLFIIVTASLSPAYSRAETLSEQPDKNDELSFIDVKDGMLDVGDYLSKVYGFLPVPIIITEPAIGYGGGLGLLYFHDKFLGEKSAPGRAIPTSITGMFAAATENDTLIGGGVHMGYYVDDTIRTVTFIALTDINIDTYVKDFPIASNMNGPVAYQAVKFRIQDTDLFLGAGYVYTSLGTSLEATIDSPGPGPDIPVSQEINESIAAVQLILEYDTRDNTLSPSSGYFINMKSNFFSDSVGSDKNFERHMLKSFFYIPVTDRLNVNLNISADTIDGDEAPFYSYPFIILRGLPIMAVQGEHILSSEIELSWDFTDRWSGLVFGGAGKAFGTSQFNKFDTSFSDSPNIYTKGVGFRYLVARKFGLKVGVDISTSEFDDAFYIQVGSAWAGF